MPSRTRNRVTLRPLAKSRSGDQMVTKLGQECRIGDTLIRVAGGSAIRVGWKYRVDLFPLREGKCALTLIDEFGNDKGPGGAWAGHVSKQCHFYKVKDK